MINRIAAGEVIERPASVVKELVENAIDAGSTDIEVVTAGGGKNLIRVSDDGHGMSAQDLELAVQRHCTSKLSNDLLDIRTLGFRGEALPSIGAVARLSIATRQEGYKGYALTVSESQIDGPKPTAWAKGTRVEVKDLFFSVPARLKFLKSDRAEANAVTDIVRRLAIANPQVTFQLAGSDRQETIYRKARKAPDDAQSAERVAQVLGKEFIENSVAIDSGKDGIRLSGFISLPTYDRANSLHQYLCVNGRPVRDPLLISAIRGGYSDTLTKGRYPVVSMFIELDPAFVDVNVHPAKSDVRFRDPGLVRGLIVGTIKKALGQVGIQSDTSSTAAALASFDRGTVPSPSFGRQGFDGQSFSQRSQNWQVATSPSRPDGFGESRQAAFETPIEPSARGTAIDNDAPQKDYPLGAARTQIHENYIVSQTTDGLVLVDQHAAHERLVYEHFKAAMEKNGVSRQMLLIPDIVDLAEDDVNNLLERATELADVGLVIEQFGPGGVAVRETPALLGEVNTQELLRDLADEISAWNKTTLVKERLNAVASRMACHGSVRSGRRMRVEEMNALLREMEETPNAGQCNHGRPTFIKLSLNEIEKLFDRH